jgi:hypothetical protein
MQGRCSGPVYSKSIQFLDAAFQSSPYPEQLLRSEIARLRVPELGYILVPNPERHSNNFNVPLPYLSLEKLREKCSELLQMTNLVIASFLSGKGFTFLDKMYSGPPELFSLATI